MPSDYIFPSFFVFMLWGPFVPPDKRLTLLLTTTKDKSKGKGSREEDRKKQLNNMRDDASTDVTAARGFSTEQRIDIENLNVKKQSLYDRQRESRIVGFSIEEAALSRQVEAAERRATLRCPEYDPINIHWQRVDALIEEQEFVLSRIRDFNEHKSTLPPTVTPFMNAPSPEKIPVSIALDSSTFTSSYTAA